MLIKQLSIFLENRSGCLHEIADVIGQADINIHSLSVADASDFGVLRLIVNEPERAAEVLRENGVTVGLTDVIAIEVPDKPGGFASVMAAFDDLGINVEYMYAFVEKKQDNAIMVFRVEDVEATCKSLIDKGVKIIKGEEVLSR